MPVTIAHLNLAKGIRGGENQTLGLMEELQKNPEVSQYLVCRKGSDIEAIANAKGLKTIGLHKPFFLGVWKLKNADLIHVHEGRSTYPALLARLLFGIPYLITRRIPNPPHDKWITRLAYGRAQAIVSLSRKIKDVMKAFTAKPLHRIIPSMARLLQADSAEVARLKERFSGNYVIGHIGALNDHHKNQSLIIEAAHRLKHKPFLFIFLGSGKDEAAFKRQAEGLDNVLFEGYKSNTADYYSTFDLFVYPSREEGLGSSILEAFGFKLPVIASNVDGIPDIIRHNENGIMVAPDDIDGFCEAILRLYHAPHEAHQLGEAGLASRENYLPEKIAARYMELYRELLA